MIRQHDVHVVAEGTFRVIMTDQRRVAAVIDVPESALGPLHLLFEVTGLPSSGGALALLGTPDRIADSAFQVASHAAPTVARPAFHLARDAAASGAQLLAHAPFLPEHERKELEAASRVVLRARLGDLAAKDFMQSVAQAAKAGTPGAQRVGDALLSGVRIVDHVLDAPLKLAEAVPLLGGPLHALPSRGSTACRRRFSGEISTR